jgi:hypothetical protein
MKKLLVIILLVISKAVLGQEIRTYNNFSVGTGFSSSSNSSMISYGEMVQKKSILPFRVMACANLKYQSFNKNSKVNFSGKNFTLLSRINSINLAIPLGFEVFQKNFGIGLNQELLSFAFKKTYDSTQVDVSKKYTASAKRLSTIFSKNKSLSGQIYLIYTVNESFAIKLGTQRENLAINFLDLNNKTKTGTIHSNTIFISIRTNIEK